MGPWGKREGGGSIALGVGGSRLVVIMGCIYHYVYCIFY